MKPGKLEQTLKKLDSGRELIGRLEKIVDKLYGTFDEESLVGLVEAEIRMELIGAEQDHVWLGSSGDLNIYWPFKEIIDRWIEVYSDDTEDSNNSLRKIGDQFCKLGRMFHEAADMPAGQ